MSFDKLTQSSERIEKLLGKRKRSFYIELSGNSSSFNISYYPAVNLEGSFEIALTSLSTYFSTPNVDSTNNSLKVFDGTTWSTVSISEGSYNIDDITSAIDIPQVRLSANLSTLKAVLEVTAPYKVDFNTPNTIGTMLGFELREYASGVSNATNTINIFNITNFRVVTNISGGSYSNNAKSNCLFSFFPSVSPGYKINETPIPINLPVTTDKLSDLYVALVDQDNKPINLRGENLTIRLHIKEV